MSCKYWNKEHQECSVNDHTYEDGYNKALEDVLKELCVGCAYLDGIKCTNKMICPCQVGQLYIVQEVNKLKK